jgi:hypothetical protein
MSFIRLLSKLSEKGCSYIILRDSQNLNTVSELDVYIPQDHKALFLDVLSELGWTERQLPSQHPYHHFYLHFSSSQIVLLDVKYELVFGKTALFTPKDPLTTTTHPQHSSIIVPDTISDALLYVFHLAFEKDQLKEKHIQQLKHLKAQLSSIQKAYHHRDLLNLCIETLIKEKKTNQQIKETLSVLLSPTVMKPSKKVKKAQSLHIHLLSPTSLSELENIPLKHSVIKYGTYSLKNWLIYLKTYVKDVITPKQLLYLHVCSTSLNIPFISPIQKKESRSLSEFICSNKKIQNFLGKPL